jgi:hypothetical protein
MLVVVPVSNTSTSDWRTTCAMPTSMSVLVPEYAVDLAAA